MTTIPPVRSYPPPQVGALLRMAWERLSDELYSGMRDAGFGELTKTQHPLLRYPPIDGLRPTQLAERLNLSKQAVNDLLRDFESSGLLTLERDPTDGRARIIRFTERGWRFFETASATSRDIGERWADQIGMARFDALLEGLRAVVDLYTEDEHTAAS